MADPVTLTAMAVMAGGTLIGGEMSASALESGAGLQAEQYRKAAADSRGSGQRQAFERQRLAKLALSQLTARAAASGGATDTDTIKLASDIAGRGEYQALGEMYTGESRARAYEDEAEATLYAAKQKARATRIKSYFDAGGTILKGSSSFGFPGGSSLPGAKPMTGYG